MSEHGLLSGRQLDEELEVLHAAFDQAKTQLKGDGNQVKRSQSVAPPFGAVLSYEERLSGIQKEQK